MSKLTMHLQRIPDWWGEFVDRSKGGLPFIVGVDTFPNMPGLTVFGRTYLPDGESNELVNEGAMGADKWIDRFAPVYAAHPHVDKWIGPNEYVIWDWEAADQFNAFHVRFIERMSALGHGVVCGQINTGWPRLRLYNDPPPYPEALAPTLGALYAHGGLFSLHEYGPGDMREGAGAHCLRYRNTRAELIAAGVVNLPQFVVTETGIDVPTLDPESDYNHWGWRHFTDWPGYFDQLKWYSGELSKDAYMLGASIFTEGGGWDSFELDRDHALALADWIGQDEPAPAPERAKGLDVCTYQGDINWPLVKADGYEFVMIRVSGPNDDRTACVVDPRFEQNYNGAGSVGLLRGGYHGLMPDVTGQARLFVETVGGRPLELGYWGDLENPALTDAKCAAFLDATDGWLAQAGPCHVYTNLNFMLNHEGLWAPGRKLWLAAWTYDLDKTPIVPAEWHDWEFWQWSNQGVDVPGVPNRTCLDVYNGTSAELKAEYGNGGGEPSMEIKVFDATGAGRDWQWVLDEFGPLDLRLAEPVTMPDGSEQVIRLVEVREQFGPVSCNVHLFDITGQPIEGAGAAWWYSTAPAIEGIPPELPTSLWEPNGDIGRTNGEGVVGFAMSEDGYYYWPDQNQIGPYGTWFLSAEHPSDGLFGIGMIAGTDHRHLNLWFQIVTVGDEPPEPPEPEGNELARLADAAERIADSLEKIAGIYK